MKEEGKRKLSNTFSFVQTLMGTAGELWVQSQGLYQPFQLDYFNALHLDSS